MGSYSPSRRVALTQFAREKINGSGVSEVGAESTVCSVPCTMLCNLQFAVKFTLCKVWSLSAGRSVRKVDALTRIELLQRVKESAAWMEHVQTMFKV